MPKKKITSRDITSSSKTVQGAWTISAIIDGHLVSRVFYYPKRDAIRLFLESVNAE